MKSCSSIAKIGFLLIFLVTLSFAIGACFLPLEPTLDITVHNQTDGTLQIFFGDAFIDDAVPGGEATIKTAGIFSKYKIIAKDMDENVVYSTTFTQDDLKGKKTYDVYFPPEDD